MNSVKKSKPKIEDKRSWKITMSPVVKVGLYNLALGSIILGVRALGMKNYELFLTLLMIPILVFMFYIIVMMWLGEI